MCDREHNPGKLRRDAGVQRVVASLSPRVTTGSCQRGEAPTLTPCVASTDDPSLNETISSHNYALLICCSSNIQLFVSIVYASALKHSMQFSTRNVRARWHSLSHCASHSVSHDARAGERRVVAAAAHRVCQQW